MKRTFRRRKNRPISNINVVPYLDVMLVLLVIFMITAPLFNQGVVDLPSVGDAPLSEQKSGALEVVYEDEGRYRLIDHDNSIESDSMDLSALLQALKTKQFCALMVCKLLFRRSGLCNTARL